MDYIDLMFLTITTPCVTYLWINSEPTQKVLNFFIKKKVIKYSGFFHRLLTCPLCSGFWIGIMAMLLYILNNEWVFLIEQIVGLSALISVLSMYVENKLNN